MDETLAFYGGAVKALGNGKIAGYGVLFTTPADPDLQGEFFTKETDLMIDIGDRRPILYRHGMHPTLKQKRGGTAIVQSVDDTGAFFEGELDVSDQYWAKVYALAESGKLGWSTGSMPHLVRKEAKEFNGKSVSQIKSWPVGEISLTPCPVEGRTAAYPVKSLDGEPDELEIKSEEPKEEVKEEEAVSLEGLPALKGLCEALSPAVNIRMVEHSKVADAAVKELLTHGRVFVDAFKHYRVRVDQHVEFRKERNRTLSDSQQESLKSWKDGLSQVRLDIESIETDLEGTLKLTENARAQADAAQRHADFLMQRLSNLSSKVAKE